MLKRKQSVIKEKTINKKKKIEEEKIEKKFKILKEDQSLCLLEDQEEYGFARTTFDKTTLPSTIFFFFFSNKFSLFSSRKE